MGTPWEGIKNSSFVQVFKFRAIPASTDVLFLATFSYLTEGGAHPPTHVLEQRNFTRAPRTS
jgi:hypothetical protein